MKSYRITTFRSLNSAITDEFDLTWDEVVEFFTSGHIQTEDKESLPLFNSIRFKTSDQVSSGPIDGYWEDRSGKKSVRRKNINALQVEMLIVDYDGGLSLEEAKERFGVYEYVAYSSYRHLYDGVTNKFRLIFPLSTPIPSFIEVDKNGHQVDRIIFSDLKQSFLRFAPNSDPASYSGTQPFFPPSAPLERMGLATSWHNQGEVLDWTKWEIDKSPRGSSYTGVSPRGVINDILSPSQEFSHSKGLIKAKDVVDIVEKVFCPFHEDKNGTEFIKRHDSGVVSFTCRHCGTFSLAPERISEPRNVDEPKDLIVDFDEDWWWHEDRQRMEDFLEETKKEILKDRGKKKVSRNLLSGGPVQYQFKSHILYLPEGSGKSRLALAFLSDPAFPYFSGKDNKYRHQIIFACKSWDQAKEQYASFKPKIEEMGRSGLVSMSFGGMIERRFGIKIQRDTALPFQAGKIREDETIKAIVDKTGFSEKFIRLTWNFLLADKVRFSNITHPDVVSNDEPTDQVVDDYNYFASFDDESQAIIFTTFAQLRLITAKKDYIPSNWIIWLDDPDIDDLIDIKKSGEGKKRKTKKLVTGEEYIPQTVLIDGTIYDVRDKDMSLGASLANHRCIYTTTERVTLKKLEHLLTNRKEPYKVHGERFKVTGGKITLLGTKTVQKKFDALIPLYTQRISKELKNDILLIADGIPSEFNHTTNKGRNDLTERDILVEVSYPHYDQVKLICDSMGLDFNTHRDEVTRELMLDKTHQALGRNSGFRSKGGECVVLIDPKRHKYLLEECGYQFNVQNSVIIDRTSKMTRMEPILSDSASPFLKKIVEYINNPHSYLADSRKVKPDIKLVLSNIKDPKKYQEYLIRLLVGLTSISHTIFTKPLPSTQQQQKVWELGNWILDTLISPDSLHTVLHRYTEEIGISESE